VLAAAATVHAERLIGYVVLAPDADGESDRLRGALEPILPASLIPAVVVTLPALPVNASGKLDRAALPAPDFAVGDDYRAPRDDREAAIAAEFAAVLELDRVGRDDDFFARGGTSLHAIRLAARLTSILGVRVSIADVLGHATPAAVARLFDHVPHRAGDAAFDVVLPIRTTGSREPLFCIHPVGGLSWAFAGLARHLDPERPLYGLQSPALGGVEPVPDSIDSWADRYVAAIREIQPDGPYHLLGWSLGGVLAHAVAVRLQRRGDSVRLLAMMDSWLTVEPGSGRPMTADDLLGGLLGLDGLAATAEPDLGLDADDVIRRLAALPEPFASLPRERVARIVAAGEESLTMTERYRPDRFTGDVVYFAASRDVPADQDGAAGWRVAVDGDVRRHLVDTTHWTMASPEALAAIGRVLNEVFQEGSQHDQSIR
jgi:thioesterase domain-containing protein